MDRRAFLRMAAAAPVAAPVLAAEAAKAAPQYASGGVVLERGYGPPILGTMRYAPPYMARPFVEPVGETSVVFSIEFDQPSLPDDLDACVRDLVERGIRPCDLTRSEA